MAISYLFFFFFLPLVSTTDLSEAEPTLTHMSIACLHKHNLVRSPFLSMTCAPLSQCNKSDQKGKRCFSQYCITVVLSEAATSV